MLFQLLFPKNEFQVVMLVSFILCTSCASNESLITITNKDFEVFVKSTKYTTDAEKFGWSIVQEDIFNFRTESDATWKKPDSENATPSDWPVTQVSYNDAKAYCEWAQVRLPTYEEYWTLVEKDDRPININSSKILAPDNVNLVGNTWDITSTFNEKGEVRLAGGSYLCNHNSCNGSDPKRKLFVSLDTGNIHIGFSIISKK